MMASDLTLMKGRSQVPIGTDDHIVVIGAVRDCAAHLESAVRAIGTALDGFASVSWYLVESDSSDSTVAVLQRLSETVSGFSYVSMGALSERMPLRTERIAFARNAGVDGFRTRAEFAKADFMAVADFDEINLGLTRAAVESSFVREDWAAVFANQSRHYYDVWALRHPQWSPDDCWGAHQALVAQGIPAATAWKLVVTSRQIHLPSTAPWIEVQSAFGGFGIYRRRWLGEAHYVGSTSAEGQHTCEHVAFHASMLTDGARLFINPGMINAGWTEHTRSHQLWRVPFRLAKRMVERRRPHAAH